MANLFLVTREGLISSNQVEMRQPLVKPTCPPNATVQAEFQTFNVHKMLKNSNVVDFEETLVKTKYPLLASIIIANNGKEQKRENYEKRWSNGEKNFCMAFSY